MVLGYGNPNPAIIEHGMEFYDIQIESCLLCSCLIQQFCCKIILNRYIIFRHSLCMNAKPGVGSRAVSGLLLFQPGSAHLDNIVSMEQRLTCANHADEDTILDEIGWNNFNCPKCGRDYSIGRRIAVRESVTLQPISHHDLSLTQVKH